MTSVNNNLNEIDNDNKDINSSQIDNIDFSELWNGFLRKRKWAYLTSTIIFIGIIGNTIKARIFNPVYQGSFTILINDPLDKDMNDKNFKNNGLSFGQGIGNNYDMAEVNTLMRLLKSPKFIESVAEKHNINSNLLSNLITVNRPVFGGYRNFEDVLEVKLVITEKVKGEEILNSLSKHYLQESLLRKQKQLKDGLNFLRKESPNIREKENVLQSKLVNFREKYNLIDPEVEGAALKVQQQNIEKQIIDLKSDNKRLENVKKEIQNGTISARGFQERLGDGLEISDFDQSLLSQLITVEKEIAIARSKYTPNSSIVKGLKSRLMQIQPLLLKNQLEAVDTAINLNNGRLKNSIELKEEIENKFNKLPILIKEYKKIKQELSFANQNLINLNATVAKYQLDLAKSTIPWRLISEPKLNPRPIKPAIGRNIFNGVIISLVMGIIVALLRDRLDHVYHSMKEMEEATNQATIGYLPYVRDFVAIRADKDISKSFLKYLENTNSLKSEDKEDTYKMFFFTESLRNIYTSINLLNSDNKLKSLMISSSIPKEGKTLINILLAKTINDMGQKVLIIDSDMRKPSIHKRLNMNNLLGLSNILSDINIKLSQVIQKSNFLENVDVITAGTIPPDPTRLLNSERFQALINEINSLNKYYLILFDTPPILGLADTILISKKVSGVIIIGGLGYTDRSILKSSVNRIKSSQANILGIIANDIKDSIGIVSNYKYGNYSYKGYQEYRTYSNYAYIEEEDTSNKKNDLNDKSKLNNFIFKLKKVTSSFRSTLFNWLDE